MLADGMRYASTRNVRRKRKSRTAPAMPLMFSHSVPRFAAGAFPSRTAATVPFPWAGVADLAGGFAFFFVAIGAVRGGGSGAVNLTTPRRLPGCTWGEPVPGRNKARPYGRALLLAIHDKRSAISA